MARDGSPRAATSSCMSTCWRACSAARCSRCSSMRTTPASSSSSTPMPGLPTRRTFKRFIGPLRHIRWVVYCKAPFAGPEQVLRYLSRYTHRVAISNRRLVCGRRQRHRVPLEGLSRGRPRPLEDDDACTSRVHPALPDPRAAEGLPPHPPLRPPRQRQPRREHRDGSRIARCRRAGPLSRPLPRLSRRMRGCMPHLAHAAVPHAHHRGVRARVRAQMAAAPHDQDRHVMSRTYCEPHRKADCKCWSRAGRDDAHAHRCEWRLQSAAATTSNEPTRPAPIADPGPGVSLHLGGGVLHATSTLTPE